MPCAIAHMGVLVLPSPMCVQLGCSVQFEVCTRSSRSRKHNYFAMRAQAGKVSRVQLAASQGAQQRVAE